MLSGVSQGLTSAMFYSARLSVKAIGSRMEGNGLRRVGGCGTVASLHVRKRLLIVSCAAERKIRESILKEIAFNCCLGHTGQINA